MRKTIDLTKEDIKKVINYQKENKKNNFSEAIRDIIRNMNQSSYKFDDIPDSKFALLADAILKMDSKINAIIANLAPKSAGEIVK